VRATAGTTSAVVPTGTFREFWNLGLFEFGTGQLYDFNAT
jgi:hypothetical protein